MATTTILDTLTDGTQVTQIAGTVTVSGLTAGLTDAELRASPVIVTVSGAAPGLTDTELRASPVPVSGTFYQATQPVSGTVSVANFPATQPVSGPLTDAEIRATALPVSGTFFQATQPVSGTVTANAGSGTMAVSAASLPLPSGAATAALQTQPGVDIGDVTINNASGAAAVNIQDGGNSITVDGTFFQATQPVSAASLPLPSGASTETTLSSVDSRLSGGTTGTITSVAANVASVTLKASNTSRKQIYLFNDSTQICYVAFASSSSASAYTIKMAAQSLYVGEHPFYSGIISGIWAAADGSGKMLVTEVT